MARKKESRAPEASRAQHGPARSPATQLEAKYREFFADLGKEGEAIGLDDLQVVVEEGLAKRGISTADTALAEVVDLLKQMIEDRSEGDGIVLRIRAGGKDVESFKVGR